MGWSYRQSFHLGPFRVTASRGGIGWSVGAGGFRTGVNAGGRTYSSAHVPGTGLTYRGSLLGVGCFLVIVGALLAGGAIALYSYFFR